MSLLGEMLTLLHFIFVLTLPHCSGRILPVQKRSEIFRPCDERNCHLPRCRCISEAIPGGLDPQQIPQIVLLTFDDEFNERNQRYLDRLLSGKRNPNGCRIQATFFVMHNYTDYDYIARLAKEGHEIADHSVSHRNPRTWWGKASYEQLWDEIVEQRRRLLSNSLLGAVQGFRSPFLEFGGNHLIGVLHDAGFLYDSSLRLYLPQHQTPIWPFTMDFPLDRRDWIVAKNMTVKFPGVWEVPLQSFQDIRGSPCYMIDVCHHKPRNEDEAFNVLWRNFKKYHSKNKAPFPLFGHTKDFRSTNFFLNAMDRFLNNITSMKDVYLVTISQAIEWIKQPTQIKRLPQFAPWQCKDEER